MSEQARAVVRMQRLAKHYKNNLLTKAGEANQDTIDSLLVDLHYYCQKHGIDLVDRMNEAAIATEPPKAKVTVISPNMQIIEGNPLHSI